jgi:hypothetical protein
MLARAFDAGVPVGWVTGDEAYGQVKSLRVWLEERDVAHVMATRRNDTVITTGWDDARVDELIAALPARGSGAGSAPDPARTAQVTTTGPGCRSGSAGRPAAGIGCSPGAASAPPAVSARAR